MSLTSNEIRVCMDIGSIEHYVVIGLSTGEILDEFKLDHNAQAIETFFNKVDKLHTKHGFPVVFAMEGYNGYARPIDTYVLIRGYKLYNVNNMKLARFKEIFPAPAKTDAIDAKKIFELFSMKDNLPMAKSALQEVSLIPEIHQKLKRFTRRRRTLVNEKTRVTNRIQGDLHAVCPGLLEMTSSMGNLWFLNFLTAREDISKLASMQKKSLLQVKLVGKKYVEDILKWQKTAKFASSVAWCGEIIYQDATRILELTRQIANLDRIISELVSESTMATCLKTIPGFGDICTAEVIGEIGSLLRFKSESSLAYYLGIAVLDKQSGKYTGAKNPRHVNTRAKAAMMVAMARHIDQNTEAKRYYDKKRAEGKKHNQALRSFGRHMVRVMWSMLKNERDYISKDEVLMKNHKVAELAEAGSTATHSLVLESIAV